jgi:hypothetical protein
MRTKPLVAVLVFAALMLASCAGGSAGPRSWLDKPLDMSHHELAPLDILAHASSAQGVESFEFFVDGVFIGVQRAAGGRLEQSSLTWNPPSDGIYVVGVRATDGKGTQGAEATSKVLIGEVSLEPPELGSPIGYGACEGVEWVSASTDPPIILPGTCSVIRWEVGAPEEWPVFINGQAVEHFGELPICLEETDYVEISVQTPAGMCRNWRAVQVSEMALELGPAEGEPEGETGIFFAADPPAIPLGECTRLVWEVSPPGEYPVELDGERVDHSGEREVCPLHSTTYVLAALRPEAPAEAVANVEVYGEEEPTPAFTQPAGPAPTTAPPMPDSTPPVISAYAYGTSDWCYIYTCDKPPCKDKRGFAIAATITDNRSSGHDITVSLNWTGLGVRSGPELMHWTGSGSSYAYNLSYFYNTGNMSNFSITATDKAGNSTTVYPTWNLGIEACGCP